MVVENRGGGGGNIGVAAVARAAPDGYTLLVTSTGFVVNPSLFRNPGYDPLRDFAPVSELGASPNVILATAQSGIASLDALVARAGRSRGGLDLANPGTGSTPHLTAELLQPDGGDRVRPGAAQQRRAGGAVAARRTPRRSGSPRCRRRSRISDRAPSGRWR